MGDHILRPDKHEDYPVLKMNHPCSEVEILIESNHIYKLNSGITTKLVFVNSSTSVHPAFHLSLLSLNEAKVV